MSIARIAVITLALCCIAVVAEVNLRGATPEFEKRLSGASTVTCDGGKKTLKLAYINDDYCDCDDGSDEPGTSACSPQNAQFYCKNARHIAASIPTAWVDDNHCDCCDGSDERPGECPDTCAKAAVEHQKQTAHLFAQYEAGFLIKQNWVRENTQTIEDKRQELIKLEAELPMLDAKEAALEKEKDRVSEEVASLKKKLEEESAPQLASIPVAEHHEHDQEHMQVEGEEEEEKNVEVPARPNFDDHPEVLKKSQDPVVKSPSSFSIAIDKLVSAFHKVYKRVYEFFVPTAKQLAENAWTTARNHRDDVKKQIDEINRILSFDFGAENEFYSLYGKNFQFQAKEYTYEIEAFQNVYQSSSGRKTNMGRWEGWENNRSTMVFKSGERCWGGPDRSTIITLECGEENKITEVKEPNKCEYTMILRTPASCMESEYKRLLKIHGQ